MQGAGAAHRGGLENRQIGGIETGMEKAIEQEIQLT